MEPTRDDLIDCFRDGVCLQVFWNATTLQRAKDVLSALNASSDNNNNNNLGINLTELALVQCHYDNAASFRQVLRILTHHACLTKLTISDNDLSSLLPDLALVLSESSSERSSLEHLELVTSRGRIRDQDACHLKRLVQIPSQTLSISFGLKQKDYGPCLLAIRHGVDQLKAVDQSPPRVCFRHVSFPDHEFHLHRFLAMLCEARCVDCLQLSPRRRACSDETEAMHVGPGFLPGLVRLLACGAVQCLELGPVLMDETNMVEAPLLSQLRHALAHNTTLQCLSLPATKNMAAVWQQAIFPALTVNCTLERLEFGYEVGLVKSFLHHLPLMKGLQSVQAPWRADDGAAWVAAVEQNQSLVQAKLVDIPDVHVHPVPPPPHADDDSCRSATLQLLERNRLCRAARRVVEEEPQTPVIVNELAGMTQEEAGLDARFLVLRESLSLFA